MHTCAMDAVLREGERIALPEAELHHALRVLRLKAGDEVLLRSADGARFLGRLTADGAAQVVRALPDNEPPLRFTLYQGLPKGEKCEWIVQKLTELGAARIVFVKMSRCVTKWEGKDVEKKLSRLQRIADEAVKQCKRGIAPEIAYEPNAERIFAAGHELMLIPWEDASGTTLKDVAREQPSPRDVAVVIGPEGGMSSEEVERWTQSGARTITLGPRILRTETAAIASAALALHIWGDLS